MFRVMWMSDCSYISIGRLHITNSTKARRRCVYRTAMQAARDRKEGPRGIAHYRNQPWETRKYIGNSRKEIPVRRWLAHF